VRRSMFAAVLVLVSGVLPSQGAFAQWWDLPNGIDNPRPRYYDYHPPGVFYGSAGPVGFAASGFLVAPNATSPAPAYGNAGYGYVAPHPAPSVASPAPAYGSAGYGYVAPHAAPSIASPAPAYGSAGYGYVAPYAAPSVAIPVAPRPLCGVYRYWQNGICNDRRGY
jgi:hypothetical protein